MLKYAVLGFLSYHPMSGYDIESWMQASTGNFWHAKLSQIYTTLKSMEAEGLVTSQIAPQEGRPDRRVYTITEAGRADLQMWISTPLVEHEVKKDSLLLKLFFGLPAGKNALLTQLRLQLDLHRQKKLEYEQNTPQEMVRFLSDQPELVNHAQLWELTRQFGVMYEAMYLQWLEEAIRFIEQQN
ncbi:MAG: PadR family transcriptional regulator [Anaerolineae bacterium]|nr:PadR family transcriptional regulator [Anaerolineae bacterium]